jgi:hypothetical protein
MPVQKRFTVALDAKKTVSNRDIEVVYQDNGNIFEITLTDDGAPMDLDGCLVFALFSTSGGTAEQDNRGNGITVCGENNNILELALLPTSAAPGLVECELQIFSGEGHDLLITTARFNFFCRRGIANQTTMEEVSQWPILVDMIKRVENGETIRNANEDARADNENGRITRDFSFGVWENYDPGKTYAPLNKATYQGSSYLCIAETTGHAPPDPAYWLLIAARGENGQGASVQALKTLSYTGWQNNTQAIYDEGIKPTSAGGVVIAQSADTEQFMAWCRLKPQATAQTNGSVTITARGVITENVDIPVVLEVRS